ncbi:MAG: citrate/2-methylcitrate synthase [bacterium]
MTKVAKGLAGVVVDTTEISNVQAEGKLSYRGHPIETLVDQPFLQVAALVVSDVLDDSLHQLLKPSMNLTAAETSFVLQVPAQTHPMKLLQGIVPLLSRSSELGYGEADQGLHVAAKLPAVVATHLRRQAVEVDVDLCYAEAFLRAIGNPASEEHVKAFNTTQILQLDHGFNAGTFAARVVASTEASVESSIAAGIGALSGPLHGGADQAVLEIADTLKTVADAREYVAAALAAGEKVPGMGHREYRAVDPRALCLQAWVEKLAVGSEHEPVYHLLREIDTQFAAAMAARGKPLYANVEFYKGLVLRVVGLPNHFFTAAFAMARAFGYVAHFMESRRDNRIFRPQAEYVGR